MKVYKPNEFAKKIGVCTRTLLRWDQSGLLKAYRAPNNYKYYTHDQYVDYCIKSGMSQGNIDIDKEAEEQVTEMNKMLNLVNNVSENDAEYLYKVNDICDNTKQRRRMNCYIAQTGCLLALGYLNNDLVWLSSTSINDLFLTRRIFDCMKVGEFYRKTTIDKALFTIGMIPRDLEMMCHVGVNDIETEHVVFTGCVSNSNISESVMTGVEFAKLMAVLPLRLKKAIEAVGADDDIFDALEKDLGILSSFSGPNQTAADICNKWRSVECLKLSDRAAIRTYYHSVCYHKYGKISEI